MPSANTTEGDLREEIRKKLEDAIRQRFVTQRDAADDLGIDLARLNSYLKKKATPSAFFLLKACKAWNLKIEFEGTEFYARRLPEKRKAAKSTPEQLPLFSVLKELENRNLDVTIGKKSLDRLELNVQIRFAS
ncbi:MAG TPA: helix-turn-helix transcriptional regulator [Candidatus Acidoferrum sp.]|nr:helix-turn-helix transcriptional regulator [Candidatus Acidoferrum sp.]